MADLLNEDIRTQKVEIVNWKFWKKQSASEKRREELKLYCRKYEKMLYKHHKTLNKRYEYSNGVKKVIHDEWEAKKLRLIKWGQFRYLPKFKKLHNLLLSMLNVLMKMDCTAAEIVHDRCQDTSAMYATLKQHAERLQTASALKKNAKSGDSNT